jgi:large subunit ribosomal protein L23
MAALGFLKSNKKKQNQTAPVGSAVLPKTDQGRLVLVRPVLSEKATRAKDERNEYIFQIAPGANKITVAKEIQSLYKVHVIKVEVSRLPAKPKRTGRYSGYRSGFRKATVRLKAGEKIELI